MENSTVTLSEKQQQRVASFKAPLEAVVGQIGQLQQQERALRMGVESLLATILEFAGVDPTARYQLSEDGKALTLVTEAQNGVAEQG